MTRCLGRLVLLAGLSTMSAVCLADANPPAPKEKVDIAQLMFLLMPWNGSYADMLDPLDINSLDIVIPGDDESSSESVDALLLDK